MGGIGGLSEIAGWRKECHGSDKHSHLCHCRLWDLYCNGGKSKFKVNDSATVCIEGSVKF